MKFNTKLIHGGQHADPSTGAVMQPIYQTSTYKQSAPGNHMGYEYGRTHNPTRQALERALTSLEGGVETIAFGSGLAAMDAILKLLKTGDEIIASSDLYGGSYRQMRAVYGQFGLVSHFVDLTNVQSFLDAVTFNTRLLWIETPTNPMLHMVDIKLLCDAAREKGIITVVDNTFASPYLQTPLELGADLVLHSATKYLGGHSDLILGLVVASREDLAERLRFIQNASGAVPGPMDCFLCLRGIKTLHVRVQRACENAKAIADFLARHPRVRKLYYPGLESHPGHELAKRQMKDFGAMISFDLHDDTSEDADRVLAKTQVFTLAESLGGVESLIGHPSSMTHASIPREDRIKVGLTDSLIRLSVGIEDVDDLIDDLNQALA